MKKMKRFNNLVTPLLILCCYLASLSVSAQDQLTIATWGGSYEKAQLTALFEPFEKETGIQINTSRYSGGLDILKSELMPDVIDMSLEDAVLACDQNLLQKMDMKSIVETIEAEFKAKKDFVENALLPCGIAHLSFSTLIAYDERVFTGEKPQHIKIFSTPNAFRVSAHYTKSPQKYWNGRS